MKKQRCPECNHVLTDKDYAVGTCPYCVSMLPGTWDKKKKETEEAVKLAEEVLP